MTPALLGISSVDLPDGKSLPPDPADCLGCDHREHRHVRRYGRGHADEAFPGRRKYEEFESAVAACGVTAKMGERVLFSRANRRVIFLPRGNAHGLRRHESVAYIQRIWVGESLADWTDPGPPNHSRFAVETDVANLTWGPVAYQYDSAGNIKSAGSDSDTYDSAGRLIQAVVGGKNESYEYDSFGNMTKSQRAHEVAHG